MTNQQPRLRAVGPRDDVYDFTRFDGDFTPAPAASAAVAPYVPQAAVVPHLGPIAPVVHQPGQQPYYGHVPAPLAAYDPRPQLLAGGGILLAGAGVCAIGVGVGTWFFFKGMALAVDSIIGLAIVAGALIYLKSASGVSIKNFHQGAGSNFQVR